MEITAAAKSKVEATTLIAECNVRYWEDGTVNGEIDEDGTLIPCRYGDMWVIVVDLETGKIADWPQGTTADVHYKVCDAGTYTLADEKGRTVVTRDDGYVPGMLSPGGSGYGDYVIMNIGPDGLIADWRPDLTYFD
jgi:hypothetical protein